MIEPLETRQLLTATIYVDPAAPGGNDGTSWNNAYHDLQSALQNAISIENAAPNSGVVIDVAQGNYAPAAGNPNAIFQLISSVGIFGGFAGAASNNPNSRNITQFKSTLNGNSSVYHVVTGSGTNSTATLDGFTITGGNAQGGGDSNSGSGAGMLNVSGNPTVANCTFSNNAAGARGGAIADINSSPTLTNCTFNSNDANDGGAIADASASNPVLVSCTFSGDIASSGGGAMYNSSSSPHLTNCIINTSHAQIGGALYDCVGSNPIITNCLLIKNVASGGGAIANSVSSPQLINCTITANTGYDGGALYNFGACSPSIANCIVYADTETTGGEIDNNATATPNISYSDIQGINTQNATNFSMDPKWVSAASGNYELKDNSPCIDAGSNAALPNGITIDLASQPRIIDGIIDMGAYESPYQSVSWFGEGDGINWNDPDNWSNEAVPTATTRVTIFSGVENLTIPAGSFAADSITSASPILISGGQLTVHNTMAVTGLTIQNSGSVNITNAGLAVNYAPDISPFGILQGYLNAGAIFSSTVNTNPQSAIGYADGSVDTGTQAAPGQVLIKYTLNGDANLDNKVNFQDLVAVVQNFNKAGTDWAHGNFNFGVSTNFNDLVTVVQNFNKVLNPAAAGTATQLGGTTILLSQSATVQTSQRTIAVNPRPSAPISTAPSIDGVSATGILNSDQPVTSIFES
jgi:hypothetical protein